MGIFSKKIFFRFGAVFALMAMLVVFQMGTGADSDLTAEQQLRADLLDILQNEDLDHALPAVHVQSAESDEELFSYNSDISVVPASGQKMLIGAAALDTLGPDYTYTTGVYSDGSHTGKVLHSDLYLKGTGDTTMLPEDFDDLAAQVADQGIKVVQGDLVADDSFFDDMRLSLDLSWFNQRRSTGAQVSALTVSPDEGYDAGTVIVEVFPSETAGEDTTVSVYPETDYITVLNDVETIEAGGPRTVDWGREHGNNNIFVDGTIPTDGARWRNWIAIWEPTELAQDLFHQALERHGVKVQGELTLGETPEGANELALKESMPLEELFDHMMKPSNNGIAESLTKTMGQEVHGEGSWNAGLDVVEDYLQGAGLNTETIQLRDGSGMSHLNKIPTEEMTALLQSVQQEDWYEIYYNSLPVAGNVDSMTGGTLRNRMQGTAAEGNVQAKTGTVTSKTSLSGYVTSQDNEELIFSIIINNYIGSHPKFIEDEIAIALAEFSRNLEE
nr:D-alanyl-D-alanine carboxypeptidase/D-alanyl-D-alanine-endopeptidase [Salipaludibacillus keqinensis]